jgi:site-specific DNA-methyltransferase (adenine-specific)
MILTCGNCLDILKNIPSESVDMVMTSPPYDNLREYHGYSFDFENVAKELYRVVKKGGVIVWVVSDAVINGSETGTSFKQALYFKEIGFNIHDTMIWAKDTLTFPDSKRYGQAFEYMFVFSKGIPKTINKICDRKNKWANTAIHGTSRGKDGITFRKSNSKNSNVKTWGERFNIWQIPGEKNNKSGHPAVYPVRLCKDHIYTWSNEGDLILDPFMGSGTTGIACKELGRDFIGIEISIEYYKIAYNRINNYNAQMTMQDVFYNKRSS